MLKDDGINILISLLAAITLGCAALKDHNLFCAFASGWFLRYVIATMMYNLKTVKE